MTKYICEKCGKEYTNKYHYTKHIHKEISCVVSETQPIETSSNKKQLGQFYTTNYNYVLQNMRIPENIKDIIEPFAGNGDLLKFIYDDAGKDSHKYNIECYDIDPKHEYMIKQDTLMNPPNFDDKYVITNPPYLARNKCNTKVLFDKYDTNDLYKCFIKILIHSKCKGGILIVPLNFISSIRISDINLRKDFIQKYNITHINIFEEKVFEDTSYSICSFQFEESTHDKEDYNTICHIYPENKIINFSLNDKNNYIIGGEIYNLCQNSKYKIERATKEYTDYTYFTNILVKCIDDSIHNKIKLSIVDEEGKDKYIDKTPNLSARSFAILVIEPKVDLDQQKMLVEQFNEFINTHRNKYNSLFLTNYRESNTIARKRVSFKLVYEICNYLLTTISL
jgi:hypothetical protein